MSANPQHSIDFLKCLDRCCEVFEHMARNNAIEALIAKGLEPVAVEVDEYVCWWQYRLSYELWKNVVAVARERFFGERDVRSD